MPLFNYIGKKMNLEQVKEIGYIPNNTIVNADCLDAMKYIPDKSVDCIICDLPYGILNTNNAETKWDIVIPFEKLWGVYERIIKDNGAIILFARQPFTSMLVMSNLKMFRYEIIWEKDKGTDFGNSNRKFLNAHENVLVFYKHQPTYNKQMEKGLPYKKQNYCNNKKGDTNFCSDNSGLYLNYGERTPKSVIKFSRDNITAGNSLHPTQKPVALLEYLIKTYSNESDLILDNCSGSGSLAIAAYNTKRNFICIERDKNYYDKSVERLRIAQAQLKLF